MDKNVICIKWGTKFGPEYVNKLYKMVQKNLSLPHRFVCFTDNAEGIVDGVEIRPLPELNDEGIPDRMWKKLTVFNKELTPKLNKPINGFINIGANPTNMALIIVDESVIDKSTTNYQNIVIGNYKNKVTIEQEREYNDYLNELDKNYNYIVETQIDIKDNSVGLSALVTFIGLYVGIIFLITSSAILALKQLSDCIDDKNKYKMLRQIGVEEKDIYKSLFYQTLIFFIAPITLALIHTIFGLQFCVLMLKTLGISNIFKDFIKTLIFLIIIYGIYFIVTYYCSKNIIRDKN